MESGSLYTECPRESFPVLNDNNSGNIWRKNFKNLNIQFKYFLNAETCGYLARLKYFLLRHSLNENVT